MDPAASKAIVKLANGCEQWLNLSDPRATDLRHA